MKVALYNFFIKLYYLGALFLSLHQPKAGEFLRGRKGLLNRMEKELGSNQAPIAWFHCASLGEFEQGKPVMEAFKKQNPEFKLLITFFSPSGYQQRKNYEGADFIYYLPLDTSTNAKRFLEYVNPSVAFFVKYEFWYHYLNQLNSSVPLYNISGLFTRNHIFFKFYGGLHRKVLHTFSHFFVQNLNSKKLLESLGVYNVTVSGDTRFDRVLNTLKSPNKYPLIEKFKDRSKIVFIGSCWPEDMAVLREFINSNPQIKFLIAPHLIDEFHVSALEKSLEAKSIRYTDLAESNVHEQNIIIVNTMGMLSSLYQYGEMAYIGGAFRDGVHNILEAVAFGLPVIFGNKNLDKFPETLELMKLGGAFSISNQAEAQSALRSLLSDEEKLKTASEVCKNYVLNKAGATEIIMNHINQT